MCQPALAANKAPQGPSTSTTLWFVTLYILSGVSQPLLMSLIKVAGLANPTTQIYMLVYYLGPSLLLLTLLGDDVQWPRTWVLLKAAAISLFDIAAQGMNYTGASLAGPTIFMIVYSSVAIWTALFSQLLLGRALNGRQWIGVVGVFIGLALAGLDSQEIGGDVVKGTTMIFLGSAMHAMTYVMSESIMTRGEELLSPRQTSAVQSVVAAVCLAAWQLVYTWPRFDDLIEQPMSKAGTTPSAAMILLGGFALANLLHSFAFYFNLKYCPGGSTSVGVMKGLQAVLVFGAASVLFCGHLGGAEMCFSAIKFLSLMTVVGGVTVFGLATLNAPTGAGTVNTRKGYMPIDDVLEVQIEELVC